MVEKKALLSHCGKYRYTLSRIWDTEKPCVMFLMLSPSTADAFSDDPTIRRCIGFAKSWGFGGLFVCNLFAYRSTNPKELLVVEDPIGPDNLTEIRRAADHSAVVVCAWGNGGIVDKLFSRFPEYKPLKGLDLQLSCLGLSKGGHPKHPLYLKKDTERKYYSF